MSSSSSLHESSKKNLEEKELLEFYQKKFDEIFRNDDRYREKIDKHLRELVADRHELESEVLRRGEKISDLQRALVDLQLSCFQEKERYLKVFAENEQLKRNEEKLHDNICKLLDATKDKDLRDRIIYVLKDPSVNVCIRENPYDKLGSDISISKKSTEEFIKEQIQSLQNKLDDHSNISKSKVDVILEDCKQTLEKSKDRLSSNEAKFRKLQNKLQQTEAELNATKQTCSELRNIIEKLSHDVPVQHPMYNDLLKQVKYGATSHSDQQNQPTGEYQSNFSHGTLRKARSEQAAWQSDPQLGTQYTNQSKYGATSQNDQQNNQSTGDYQSNLSQDTLRKAQSEQAAWQFDAQIGTQHTNQSNNLHRKLKSASTTFLSKENTEKTSDVRKTSPLINNPSFPTFKINKDLSKSSIAIVSNASNMHLSLVMLSKILTKLLSITDNIQSTEVFVEMAKLETKPSGSKYAKETDVTQLQNYIPQCTRLTYDIKNMWKQLEKVMKSRKDETQYDMIELESAVEELAATTAEVELLSICLSRSTFYSYLTGPKQSFEKYGMKDMNNHSKYVSDFKKIEANLKATKNFNIKAVEIMEKIIRQFGGSSVEKVKPSESRMNNWEISPEKPKYSFKVPSTSRINESSGKDMHDREKLVMSHDFPKFSSDSIIKNDDPDYSFPIRTDDVTRRINKTLAKISKLESGEYIKDDEYGKHLGQQVNSLSEKLKALYEEFNVKSLQDQFAEYSSVTFSKLEALAKQSRDAVIAAEAQISAQRTNAQHLSNKLRSTEELLRESIDECLLLKQKLFVLDIKNETDKMKFRDHLQERLSKVQDFDELETAVKEVASSLQPSKDRGKPAGPYECLYCKQGTGHKSCEEKIKELRTNNRKLTTEIKLLQQEIKEEKKLSKMSDDQKNKMSQESSLQIENLKENVQTLEAKNVSLLEQLKLDKNRLKKMERFRRLEIEGFQSDIKNLKSKIQDMEKQLGKAVSIFANERKDMDFLESMHNTTEHSRQAATAIRRLKAKLYELEREFKHL